MKFSPKKLKNIMFASTVCCGVNAHADAIDVAVLDFCPFACSSNEDAEGLGFVLELEKAIFEREGHQVNFHIVPYIRSLKGTEIGTYDAVGVCNDHSSEVNICSNESIGPMIYTFYVKKGNSWRYTDINSIKRISLGTIAGYNYTQISPEFQDYIDANQNNEKRVQVHHGSGDLLFRMLRRVELRRIDTFSEASYVADYNIRKHGFTHRFEKAGVFPNILWGRMCFSPTNPKAREYAELVDKGMKEMRASGELQAIMQKYGLEVWEPETPSD